MSPENSTLTRAAMLSLVAETIARALYEAHRIFLPADVSASSPTWEALKPIDRAGYGRRAERAILDLDYETAQLARTRTAQSVTSLIEYSHGDAMPDLPAGFMWEVIESAIQGYGMELSKVWAATTRRMPVGIVGACANCHEVMIGHYDGSVECVSCGLIRRAE